MAGRIGQWMGGWVGGSGSFCKWGSVLVPVGAGPVGPFIGTIFSFSPLYRPALAKFEYEPTHLFAAIRTAVLCCSTWPVGSLVGGCLG